MKVDTNLARSETPRAIQMVKQTKINLTPIRRQARFNAQRELLPSVAGQNLVNEREHVAKPRKRTKINAKLQTRERASGRMA